MPRAQIVAPEGYTEVVPLLKQRLSDLSLWAGWAGLFRSRRCVVNGWGAKPLAEAALADLFAAMRVMEGLGVDRPWMMELDGTLVAARKVGEEHWVIATARPGLHMVFQSALHGVARNLEPLVGQLEG